MSSIQIISDTAHNLPEEISRQIPMVEVPFAVIVGDVIYEDNQFSLTAFAALLEHRRSSYPTTAAPSHGQYLKAYQASSEFDGILVVTIGSKNSATYANAKLAVQMYREGTGSHVPIEVVDSCGGTMTQGFLLMKADQLIKAGKSLEEIAATLRSDATGDNLVFALRETTYLYRSGRAQRFQHVFASVLRFKPVLGLVDGELGLVGRVRGGQEKAQAMVATEVLRRCNRDIRKLAIIGGLGTEAGEQMVLKQILSGLKSKPEIIRTKICAAMMVNLGPHAVGAAWV